MGCAVIEGRGLKQADGRRSAIAEQVVNVAYGGVGRSGGRGARRGGGRGERECRFDTSGRGALKF